MKNYKQLYEQEKKRADLLQADLDIVDELHYDECEKLHMIISELKLRLKNKKN